MSLSVTSGSDSVGVDVSVHAELRKWLGAAVGSRDRGPEAACRRHVPRGGCEGARPAEDGAGADGADGALRRPPASSPRPPLRSAPPASCKVRISLHSAVCLSPALRSLPVPRAPPPLPLSGAESPCPSVRFTSPTSGGP